MAHDIDAALLRAFVTAAETGNLSAAADRLARTQAAVSMQIRRLEDDLGHRLFDRSPRGVSLTEPGRVFLGFARQALGAAEAGRQALEGTEVVGSVRLGVLEDIAVGGLMGQIARFAASYPDVRLDLIIDRGPRLEGMLGRGEIEICISAGMDRGLKADRTRTHKLLWVAAASFDPSSFHELPLVLMDIDGPNRWRDMATAALTKHNRKWRVAVTATSLAASQAAVAEGLGVGFMVDVAAEAFGLRPVPASAGLPEPPKLKIGVFTTQFTRTDPAAMALAGFISEEWRRGR